jgi:arsenate reductase-like glutaredoxin family protein
LQKTYVKIAKNQIQNLQIKNKEVYKIILESQVKEKPIAYTKWEKCLKDRMHTLTCITQTLFFTFKYLELNKLKIFKGKLIHFILSCNELLKQWRIVHNSDCLVCKEKENYKHFYFDCKYNKNIGKS